MNGDAEVYGGSGLGNLRRRGSSACRVAPPALFAQHHPAAPGGRVLSEPGQCARAKRLVKGLPYKLATLLYCFNERDEALLLERAQEPNLGLWSPCGGKLHTDTGESPYACACREAQEELGLTLSPSDLHLTGLVSEHGYQGQTHWLMFLFEVKRQVDGAAARASRRPLSVLPARALCRAGRYRRRTASAFGPGSGSTAAASSPRIAIATRMAATSGRWRNQESLSGRTHH